MKKLVFAILCFTLILGNCSQTQNPSSSPTDKVISFEAFKATVYKEPIENGKYIVDGDLPIANEAKLKDFYDHYLAKSRLIVHQENGVEAKWNDTQKQQLTYCINNKATSYFGGGFGSNYAAAKLAMQQATQAWMDIADVTFIHLESEDGNCTSSNNNVIFDVNPAPSTATYLARAFFPNESRSGRNVLVASDSFTLSGSRYTLAGVLRHELGHALGFRHEHTRPESGHNNEWDPDNGKCYEDSNWSALTPYDPFSVMHYPQCNGDNTGDLILTDQDIAGAQKLYGSAAGSINITAPKNNSKVKGTITITAEAAKAANVKIYVNNALICEDTAAPFSCEYNTSSLSDNTTLALKAVGTTAEGQIVDEDTTVVTDNTAPTLTISPEGGTFDGAVTVTFNASETADFYYTLDGSVPDLSSTKAASATIRTSANLKVIAVDQAGNTSAVKTSSYTINFSCQTFTATNYAHVAAGRAVTYTQYYNTYAKTKGSGEDLGSYGSTWYSPSTTLSETAPGYFVKGDKCPAGPDTTAPQVAFSSPVNNSNVSGVVAVKIQASDNVGVTKIELYINENIAGTSNSDTYNFNWDTSSLDNGNYTLKAIAFDAAGNTSNKQITVTLDKTTITCKEFTTSNKEHVAAGRAEIYTKYYSEYVRTIGSGEDLGLLGSSWYSAVTTVKETKPGYFAKGSCN